MDQVEKGSRSLKGVHGLFGDLVCAHCTVGPLEGLQAELLNVCLTSHLIQDRVVGWVLRFDLMVISGQ